MIKSDHPNILIAAAEVISCLCTLAGNSSRHSLKVTIHLIAIWKKWCQHDFMKNHETAQILSQSLSLAGKLNWPNYNAAYTYRTAFVIYAQVHCTIAQLQQCHLDKQLQVYTECPCSDDKSVQRIHALSNEAVVVLLFIMAVLLGPQIICLGFDTSFTNSFLYVMHQKRP